MTRYALGIDAGATNLRCALVNDQGQILFEIREPSKGIWNGPAYMDQLTGLAQRMLAGPFQMPLDGSRISNRICP